MNGGGRKKPGEPGYSSFSPAPSFSDGFGSESDGARSGSMDDGFVKVPSLAAPTLPKGGGAIRGIGEKFTMSPLTGTGSMTVPLALSPGRSGMGPSINVSYDSGIGNGPFGVGWSLAVPSIRRKTDKGLPEYMDIDESDTFLLSGAEDLVPGLVDVGGGDWQRIDVDDRNGETIERFRPRVEGLFSRIERHKVIATGNVYWVTVTKENVTSVYGRNANARIAHPDFAPEVFEWLLEATYDDKGNVVYYEYKAEDKANVAASAHESHRTDQSVSAQRYLKRIHYGNTTMRLGPDLTDTQIQSNTWLFEVVFDYGEHHATVPTPSESQTWSARQDPFSTYKPGFEVRTYRLCKRVLMFHNIAELGTGSILVRSTEFAFSEGAVFSYLTSVTHKGWIKDGSSYTTKAIPPVELGYQLPVIDTTIKLAEAETRHTFPPVNGRATRWVDLEGEGIAGLLTEQPGGGLYYQRNLGGAELAPSNMLLTRPIGTALSQGAQQLMDLDADGNLELVDFSDSAPGFYSRSKKEWEDFVPFRSIPNIDFRDPNLQFVDINGDGFADILKTEGDRLVWYPSLGAKGFDAGIVILLGLDEDKSPHVLFSDTHQGVFVADMSGDGLGDIVCITAGSVGYWPNRGYGKFGEKITMSGAPFLDRLDLFDPQRIRLADIDGSGTTDVAYLGADGVTIWFNQAGNSFSSGVAVENIPTHHFASISFADFLGNGTQCLLWSSTSPGEAPTSLRYVDLLSSTKPHLLISIKNNLGLTTTLEYASSTKFYLDDKAAGVEWVTRLGFPVHVVKRMETYEAVTKIRLVTTYKYRHGYYDGPEREFRGFGYVEQRDAESYSPQLGAGEFPDNTTEGLLPTDSVTGEFVLPAVVKKSWFHTGAWKDLADIASAFADEYTGDSPLDATLFMNLAPLTAEEEREAARALKGSILREEIYAEDQVDWEEKPFSVAEKCYAVRRLQPIAQGTKHAVYVAHAREAIDFYYERSLSDPRVSHALTIAVDDYGVVTKAVAIRYARRGSPQSAPLTEQNKLWATLTETDVVHKDASDTWYRIGVPKETRSYELTNSSTLTGSTKLSFATVESAANGASEIAYETAPTSGNQKRLLKKMRAIYMKDDLSGVVTSGDVESKGLLHHTESLALTGGLISATYDTSIVTSTLLTTECKYIQVSSDYFAQSGVPTYDSTKFYAMTKFTEPYGNRAAVTLDSYSLLPTETHSSETTSSLDNVTSFTNDYRVLAPSLVTDPNDNRVEVAFDELGLVTKMAVKGKSTESLGDTLSDPTMEFTYDLFSWKNTEGSTNIPAYAHTKARKEHQGTASWQETRSYTAGNGKEVLRKVQAEPDGGNPRWVGNGRTVWDNKGNPIKQYEPYFATSNTYDTELSIASSGVTPIMRYDALSRLIRTDFPNGTYSKVTFTPWKQESWDPNDTVLDSEWYDINHALSSGTPMRRAADITETHDGTPTIAHVDGLGRTFLTQADNGTSSSHTFYNTTVALDVEGNALTITDARGNATLAHTYCPMGVAIKTISAEAGTSKMLHTTGRTQVRSWNSRDVAARSTFDELRRPTLLYVKIASGTEFLAQRTLYGEGLGSSASKAANLRTRVYRIYDSAGAVTNVSHDFKGNLIETNRKLDVTYTSTRDWIAIATETNYSTIESTVSSYLSSETFTTTNAYDALNRIKSITTPDSPNPSVYLPTYNEAGLLNAVDVKIRGSSTATAFVRNIDYNARGQRTSISYAGTSSATFTTTYTYDSQTFRLSNQETIRASDSKVLQDFTLYYDPVGNIVETADTADQDAFFDYTTPAPVAPAGKYTYDAIYRLLTATGREHPGQGPVNDTDSPLATHRHPNDSSAMRSYTETYDYDEVGNILEMFHDCAGTANDWTRTNTYASGSNRLATSQITGTSSFTYTHDNRGNMTSMPHLSSIGWDYADRMQSCALGGGGNVYFTYDHAGQRVRKVWDHSSQLDERIYLGTYELFRMTTSSLQTERQTLHVMDDTRRIAMVETLTVSGGSTVSSPESRQRYQLNNQIESASVELTETGAIITYEEFFPFGATSFRSKDGSSDVSAKRYRYTGKERDEETGLNYHGARYYAPWLGRWTAVDPSIGKEGIDLNAYAYVRNSLISHNDPTGMQGNDPNSLVRDPSGWLLPTSWGVAARTQAALQTAKAERSSVLRATSNLTTDPFGLWRQPIATKPNEKEQTATPSPTVQQSRPTPMAAERKDDEETGKQPSNLVEAKGGVAGSKDAAGIAAIKDILSVSKVQQREYGGLIYTLPNSPNNFHYTAPKGGADATEGPDFSAFVLPPGAVVVATYHTHPKSDYTFGTDDPNDLNIARNFGGTAYVGTRSGEVARVRVFSPPPGDPKDLKKPDPSTFRFEVRRNLDPGPHVRKP